MKFVIDRSKWRCGGGSFYYHGKGIVSLINEQGYKCCLGFVCEQSGVPSKAILNVPAPNSPAFPVEHADKVKFLSERKNPDDRFGLMGRAVEINDALQPYYAAMTLPQRERALSNLFAEFGHELEFVGEYEDDNAED